MPSPTTVYLYGSLQADHDLSAGTPLTADLETPLPLLEVIEKLGIARDRIRLAMVNYQSVSPATMIHPGDRVALFPKEYPIFADWLDHRF